MHGGDPAPVLSPNATTDRRPVVHGPSSRVQRSDDPDVLRFLTLAAGSDIELDALALVEGPVAPALDVGVMYEHVVTLFT